MRLLTIMERHIRDGLHLQLQCNAEQVSNFIVLHQNFIVIYSLTLSLKIHCVSL